MLCLAIENTKEKLKCFICKNLKCTSLGYRFVIQMFILEKPNIPIL